MSVAVSYPGVDREAGPDWTEVCTWACLSLHNAPSAAVESIAVTLDLTGAAPADVWALARATAARFGLRSSAVVKDHSLTVRFTRPTQA